MPIDRPAPYTPTRNKVIVFTGGYNTEISNLEIPPGDLHAVQNMMEVDGISHGYTSIAGYEGFSGFTDTVHGESVSLPSEVDRIGYSAWDSGTSYIAWDRVSYNGYVFYCILAHSNQTPDDTPGDNTYWKYENTVALADTLSDNAREDFRGDITAVGSTAGEGAVKWVDQYGDGIYAFRKVDSAAYDGLWKTSATGWTAMSTTLTLATTYKSMVARFSEFESNDDTLFWVNGVDNKVHYTDGTTVSSFDGPDTTGYPEHITIFKNRLILGYPDGHLFFSTVGLYGTVDATHKIYFDKGTVEFTDAATLTDGTATAVITSYKKTAGEWANGDAEGVIFIKTLVGNFTTGLTLTGGSGGSATSDGTQLSSSVWDAGVGAGEILVGEDITGLQEAPGGVLVIFKSKVIDVLYYEGTYTDTGDAFIYRLENFSTRSGCIINSNQRLLGSLFFADDRGVTNLSAVQAFGDFSSNAISKKVQQYYLANKGSITASVVHREFNQYRLFFADKGIYFTFQDKELRGATLVNFDHEVRCISEGEDTNGDVVTYFGTEDGYIMKLDSGTSFNGENIDCQMKTSFFHYGSPRNWKRFLKALFEITAENDTTFYLKTEYNYEDIKVPETLSQSFIGEGIGGIWDEDIWDQFTYGGGVVGSYMNYLAGVGVNMSIEIRTSEKYTDQFIIHNMIVDYQLLGAQA